MECRVQLAQFSLFDSDAALAPVLLSLVCPLVAVRATANTAEQSGLHVQADLEDLVAGLPCQGQSPNQDALPTLDSRLMSVSSLQAAVVAAAAAPHQLELTVEIDVGPLACRLSPPTAQALSRLRDVKPVQKRPTAHASSPPAHSSPFAPCATRLAIKAMAKSAQALALVAPPIAPAHGLSEHVLGFGWQPWTLAAEGSAEGPTLSPSGSVTLEFPLLRAAMFSQTQMDEADGTALLEKGARDLLVVSSLAVDARLAGGAAPGLHLSVRVEDIDGGYSMQSHVEVFDICTGLGSALLPPSATRPALSPSASSRPLSSAPPSLPFSLSLDANAVRLSSALANGSSMQVDLHPLQLRLSSSKTRPGATLPELELGVAHALLLLNGHELVTLSEVTLSTAVSEEEAASLRKRAGASRHRPVPRLADGSADFVVVEVAEGCFHHDYNFDLGEALEDIKCVLKVAKMLHGVEEADAARRAARAAGTLPPPRPSFNTVFRLRSLSLEFADDPFEIALDYNHALLVEEVAEQAQRERVLAAKIEAMRDTPGQDMTDERAEALFHSLQCKNAQIYCQRAQKLRASTQQRTALIAIKACNVELVALTDTRLTGAEQVKAEIRRIDPDCPMPADVSHDLVIAREAALSWDKLDMLIRDYPRPLLAAQQTTAVGTIIIAEPLPAELSKRKEQVRVCDGLVLTVAKGMTPLKFYHELDVMAESMSVAHGPCIEPALAQFGLVVDLLTKASVDPSPPLPWYDKLRLLRHGRLDLRVRRFAALLLGALDPHDPSNSLDWHIASLCVELTASRLALRGDTDVRLSVPSKFHRCPLFHMPGLVIDAKLKWRCVGDPRDHHTPIPVPPANVARFHAERSPSEPPPAQHDSYAQFRSSGLDIDLDMRIEEKKEGGVADEDGVESQDSAASSSGAERKMLRGQAACLLYSSTLKWLKEFQKTLYSVTRPIRRGTLYSKEPAPHKPSLTQHMKTIDLRASIPRFVTLYFNSYERRNGLRMQFDRFAFRGTYHHLLMPQPALFRAAGQPPIANSDNLIRRDNIEWTTFVGEGTATNLHVVVLETEARHSDKMALKRGFLLTDLPAAAAPEFLCSDRLLVLDFLKSELVSYRRSPTAATWAHAARHNSISRRPSTSEGMGAPASPLPEAAERLKSPMLLRTDSAESTGGARLDDAYAHTFKVADMQWSWTPRTREIFLTIYNTYTEARSLKFDLSSNALKAEISTARDAAMTSIHVESTAESEGNQMLAQLLADVDRRVVSAADSSSGQNAAEEREQARVAVTLQDEDDVLANEVLIEFSRPQVAFIGPETQIAVTVTAEDVQLRLRKHHLVKRQGRLDCKDSWVADLDKLQYFVGPNNQAFWVPLSCVTPSADLADRGTRIAAFRAMGRNHHHNNNSSGSEAGATESAGLGPGAGSTAGSTANSGSSSPAMSRRPTTATSSTGASTGSVRAALWPVDHEDLPADIHCVVPPCNLRYHQVKYYHDSEIAHTQAASAAVAQRGATSSGIAPEKLTDRLTLTFDQLDMLINSKQWQALLDVYNNLIFVTDKAEQERIDRLETLKYKAQLTRADETQRANTLLDLQATVRALIARNEELEHEIMMKSRDEESGGAGSAGVDGDGDGAAAADAAAATTAADVDLLRLEEEWGRNKRLLRSARRDLHLRVQSYRESLLDSSSQRQADEDVEKIDRYHTFIRQGVWLFVAGKTVPLPLVEARLERMEYGYVSHANGSGETRIGIGDVQLINCLANEKYPEMLVRLERASEGFDRNMMSRWYSRDGMPVGGIPVKEHFEFNTVPLKVQLSFRLYTELMRFFFPEDSGGGEDKDKDKRSERDRDRDEVEGGGVAAGRRVSADLLGGEGGEGDGPGDAAAGAGNVSLASSSSSVATAPSLPSSTSSSKLVAPPRSKRGRGRAKQDIDADVDEMKARAQNNITFIYGKIPGVTVCVSYQGEKDKSLTDLDNYTLALPTFEYQNRTGTWHDIVDQYKSDCTGHVISQVIKRKVGLSGRDSVSAGSATGAHGASKHAAATGDARETLLLGRRSGSPGTARRALKVFGKKLFRKGGGAGAAAEASGGAAGGSGAGAAASGNGGYGDEGSSSREDSPVAGMGLSDSGDFSSTFNALLGSSGDKAP